MKYFVIEGIDTSGKTTQYNMLRQKFSCVYLSEYKDSNDIILLNEPGGTEFGNLIRDILLNGQYNISSRASFLLFLAQRAEIFEKIKHLDNIIISDRSLISGMAYANTLDIKQALELNLFATQYNLPQKIAFLKLTKDSLEKRLAKKSIDNIEKLGVEYLLNIQKRFIDIFKYLEDMRYNNEKIQIPEILILDANLSINTLHEEICNFFGI